VPSPTYTLVEPYTIGAMIIYHIDLYRIDSAEELHHLGFGDLTDGLLLIEWPEHAAGLMERADLLIELDIEGAGRVAELRALRERAADMVEQIRPSGDWATP
jgi:tRNA threonylcarbamoyladenosine biosynthesis protein TsaE